MLTKREREICTMARDGLCNRDIAFLLFVSTRTVEGHLHRAYGKLGINSREELTDALQGSEETHG